MDKTWKLFIEAEQEKPYFKNLTDFVTKERETYDVFPKEEETFNAFELCMFKDVRMVILGQDPYHDFHQAHGLSFSVNKRVPIPRSLQNIFKEYHSDLGYSIPQSGDLSKWAKEGVLLLNTILTVRAHKPLSHQKKGWETFTDKVICFLNQDNKPKVFVLWGNNAIKKEGLITNPKHLIITSSHPSPLSARHSFFGSKLFSKTNQFLKQNNLSEIDFKLD